MAGLPERLAGPVELALARADEKLPGEHEMPGPLWPNVGSRWGRIREKWGHC